VQADKQKEITVTPVIAGLTRNLQIAFMVLGDCGSEAAMTESAGGAVIGRNEATKQSGAARNVHVPAVACAAFCVRIASLRDATLPGLFCGAVIAGLTRNPLKDNARFSGDPAFNAG
jgi:hypothetical protein